MSDRELLEIKRKLAIVTAEINSPHYALMMFVVYPAFYAIIFGLWYWLDGTFHAGIGLIGVMAGFHAICAAGLAIHYAARAIVKATTKTWRTSK